MYASNLLFALTILQPHQIYKYAVRDYYSNLHESRDDNLHIQDNTFLPLLNQTLMNGNYWNLFDILFRADLRDEILKPRQNNQSHKFDTLPQAHQLNSIFFVYENYLHFYY